MLDGS
jgi:hypothetical protein